MRDGAVFEQGGVGFSGFGVPIYHPQFWRNAQRQLGMNGSPWYLDGVASRNPYVPTVHLNYRYFEAGPVWWFGGGADLTPIIPLPRMQPNSTLH